MTIKWFGQSFFKINVKNTKGEDITIAIVKVLTEAKIQFT